MLDMRASFVSALSRGKLYILGAEGMLVLMAASMPLSFAVWMALLNNFAIEKAAFTAFEMGILQSLREIPGFLAFAVVYLLLFIREQKLALLSLLLLGAGVFATGFFANLAGLYVTTVIMSVGFHYYETIQTSLTWQLIDKRRAPMAFAWQISARSLASILVFALIFFGYEFFALSYIWLYGIGGGATILLAVICIFGYPHFPCAVEQHKKLILRKKYWLFYSLTFMSGARRQVFIVFAAFMMVDKFGYDVTMIVVLHFINYLINLWLPPYVGRFIARYGERTALLLEYSGLILIFTAYAFVEIGWLAGVLYVLDYMFFSFAIAIKTYFQKIADPKDIAATAGVSFSINHIAAVIIPVLFGMIWLYSSALVFLLGALMAFVSLVLSLFVASSLSGFQRRSLAGDSAEL